MLCNFLEPVFNERQTGMLERAMGRSNIVPHYTKPSPINHKSTYQFSIYMCMMVCYKVDLLE